MREGKKTVKAIALSRDGTRESHIVTKTFEVDRCDGKDNGGNVENNNTRTNRHEDYEFIDELERERKKEILKKRSILKKIVDNSNLSYRSSNLFILKFEN